MHTAIAMAHGLKLRVLAKGVYTQAQLEILRDNHCENIQGYFFSQPLPSDLLEQLVRSNRSKHRPSGPPLSSLPLAS